MRRVLSLLFFLAGVSAAGAQPVIPAGFEDALVATVASPTALAFTPDGRLLITTQPGRLRIVHNGALLSTPALDLSTVSCTNSERGMLGVAVDPAFASNRTIYIYYTLSKADASCVNRVSRFVLPDTNVIARASEVVLVDNIMSPRGNHNGGDLHFGRDGFLYISIGDGGCHYLDPTRCAGANDAAREPHVLLGKILRITRDGGIPTSNPYRGTNSVRCNVTGRAQPGQTCQETFASGLRNPFRIAFDPNAGGTRFFINDVGQNVWEEIDLGQPGADYGWNIREGHCANGSTTDCGAPPGALVNPVFDYGHADGCASITGGAFVPNGVWPAAYDNTYLFGDYVCGQIFVLTERADGTYARSNFATNLGNSSAVAMIFGPHGASSALYYTTYAGGGQVRRIAQAANRAPQVSATATPTSGAVPLSVRLDASGSTDPDGDALTFSWSFGDGTANASGAIVTHSYAAAGRYTAVVTVTDSKGARGTASVQIEAGNRPPQPTILSPSSSARFAVGETITLQGSGSDPEDGTLAGSNLSWRVILHHNTHTHPFVGPVTGATSTFQAPSPEDLAATSTSYLEIELTATDRSGASTVVRQNLQPRLVAVSLATNPTGLTLTVNGTSFTTPAQITSWQNYKLTVGAPDQSDSGGTLRVFASWSDGGARDHVVTTPSTATTCTATFGRGHRLSASADAFVRAGSYAARNFGTQATLESKLSSAEYTRQSYLKFNVAGVPAIGAARLRVYGGLPDTRDLNTPVDVSAVASTSWSETGITWNNRPALGTKLSTVRIPDAIARYYEFDITAYARAEKAAGRNTITLAVSNPSVTSAVVGFNAREASSNRPELVIAEPPGTSGGTGDIVLYAGEAVFFGGWSPVPDASAALGQRMSEPDAARPKLTAPLANPGSYFELTFTAEANRPYRLWIRGRAASNYYGNDSAFVQFSGSITSTGAATFRIGTSSATTYVLEDCSGCGLSGWGWQDNEYGVNALGPPIYFATSDPQTIRIQTREDGLSIDQIVLSPSTWLTARPGATKNDATIVPR